MKGDDLSERNNKIYALRAQGVATKKIAEIVGLSPTRVGEILRDKPMDGDIKRRCLSCDREFYTDSRFIRRCMRCKKDD